MDATTFSSIPTSTWSHHVHRWLKDYFDQQLRKLVAVPGKLRQVKLTIV